MNADLVFLGGGWGDRWQGKERGFTHDIFILEGFPVGALEEGDDAAGALGGAAVVFAVWPEGCDAG